MRHHHQTHQSEIDQSLEHYMLFNLSLSFSQTLQLSAIDDYNH